MASKDWKLPDAQHKITEEKGLDIENESIQRQWEKTIVSLIRLEDAFSDIDVYDDTEEGEIPYRQYLMRRWLFIHQDKYKNETLKDEDKKKVNTQQINQMYSDDDKSKTADLNAVRDLLDKRQSLSDQIEQLEQEKTAIEQQVKLEMQDAAYGTAPGYKVSWVSSESKRVDSQRLRKEQPDIFNQYSKNVSSRRFTIVHAA